MGENKIIGANLTIVIKIGKNAFDCFKSSGNVYQDDVTNYDWL